MKKVLLVVIDALSSRVVPDAIAAGTLPTLGRLCDQGVLRETCTSVFPSITPAATASIITGVYPADHGIAGNFWFDRDEDTVAYFGDDFRVILNAGFGSFFSDYLVRLNSHRLRNSTLYETVERSGRTAAVLNFMWFRGDHSHQVNMPLLLQLMAGGKPAESISGPSVLGLADFARSLRPGGDKQLDASGGVLRRFGFHDDTTGEFLLDLAKADPFPDLTLAYFPNNDFESHKIGSEQALTVVQGVDQHLHEFFERRGGLERFLNEAAVVVVGDHSQCHMHSNVETRGIDLSDLLSNFKLATPGNNWNEEDELMICPNMRAAQIYVRHENRRLANHVVEKVLEEPRIDQVLWHDETDSREVFHVRTSDRGALQFWRSPSEPNVTDQHGGKWGVSGDLSVVKAEVAADETLKYSDYPNALERIAGGFCDQTADLWITAHPGYEFRVPETSIHEGGSHGSLHKLDSESPLIVAGAIDRSLVPQHPRIVDVAPIVLEILDVSPR